MSVPHWEKGELDTLEKLRGLNPTQNFNINDFFRDAESNGCKCSSMDVVLPRKTCSNLFNRDLDIISHVNIFFTKKMDWMD